MSILAEEWNVPPHDLTLLSHEVHIWRAWLNQSQDMVNEFAQVLSDDERARGDRFYSEKDRAHFIIGRGLLRTILGRYLKSHPTRVMFCYGAYGKPALAVTHCQSYHFNLSHSQGLAVYAITLGRPVGIDLEYIRPVADVEGIVERFFSIQEQATFVQLPDEQKLLAFFQGWTCKEAYLKAIGDGLTQPLHHVEVVVTPGLTTQLLNIVGDSQEVKLWSLHRFQPADQFIGAIAIQEPAPQFKRWQWSNERP